MGFFSHTGSLFYLTIYLTNVVFFFAGNRVAADLPVLNSSQVPGQRNKNIESPLESVFYNWNMYILFLAFWHQSKYNTLYCSWLLCICILCNVLINQIILGLILEPNNNWEMQSILSTVFAGQGWSLLDMQIFSISVTTRYESSFAWIPGVWYSA